jgi:hypothetical protein
VIWVFFFFPEIKIPLFYCRNSGDTLRTLRFGQRVKFIRNEPVINEIREDDVNDLSDQIRQLKVLSFPAGVIIEILFQRLLLAAS